MKIAFREKYVFVESSKGAMRSTPAGMAVCAGGGLLIIAYRSCQSDVMLFQKLRIRPALAHVTELRVKGFHYGFIFETGPEVGHGREQV
ncbi:hypothetical protein VV869_05145 [Photobacterium sp. MCCC 1A19761]|uniref:hypothetical protein n=1 Tax=Photobacterium sp. MCCC 1A19761 TaxID=3115000 RepID=UPI00307F8E48